MRTSPTGTRRSRPWAGLLLVLVLLGAAGAEDAPAKKDVRRTPDQAAAEVIKAFEARNATAIATLAGKDDPDPWRVAEALLRLGRHEVAEAFARSAPRPAIDALPAYVGRRRATVFSDPDAPLLTSMRAAMEAGDVESVLAGTADVGGKLDTVPRILLLAVRAFALQGKRGDAEARSAFLRAAQAARDLGWWKYACFALKQASGCAVRQGDHGSVGQDTRAWREVAQRGGLPREAAQALHWLGFSLKSRFEYGESLEAFKQAHDEFLKAGDAASAAETRWNRGIVHHRRGEFEHALAVLEQALQEAHDADQDVLHARILTSLGLVNQSLGRYAQALGFYRRSLEAKASSGDSLGVAVVRLNMGYLYMELGDMVRARKLTEQALAGYRAENHSSGVVASLINLGTLYYLAGARDKAKALFEDGLELAERGKHRRWMSRAVNNLATLHEDAEDWDRALAAYQRALDLNRSMDDQEGEAAVLINIGRTLRRVGRSSEGLAELRRGARLARRLRAGRWLVFGLKELARAYLEDGAAGRALATAQQALTQVEALFEGLDDVEGAEARTSYASLFALGALAATRLEAPPEALTFLESGRAGALLDVLGKSEFLHWKTRSLPPELLEADRAARTAEREARRAYDAAARQRKIEPRRRARRALEEAQARVREVSGQFQRELKSQLKRQAALFYPRAETIDTIEMVLQEDQAMVIYGLCLDTALALVLRQDGERLVELGKVDKLLAACELLAAVDKATDPSEALARLRRLLVDPLKLGEDVRGVLVSPEGPLCYLPFGALFEQTVTLTLSGSTHVLLKDTPTPRGQGVLALGDPDFTGTSEEAQRIYWRGRSLARLPASREEAKQVGTTSLVGIEASEQGLREALAKQKRWKSVHFATHGLIDVERPMQSSLALTRVGEDDGFFTAREVLRMQIPADLVVLSACDTGTGRIVEGEGIVGLTRAFMFAGAPRVICSLWKVDDEATKALMVKFYEFWNPQDEKKGLGAAAALKKAQEYVRDFKNESGKQMWKHPYYWAAWVLWGLPD